MKRTMKSILIVALLLLGLGSLQAQTATAEFKVYGNCGMCEARIEKAAESIEGIESADWDKETKMIDVKYDPAQVETLEIHKAIAKVGHDTEKVKADDKTYDELPGCCRYDREEDSKKEED